MNYWLLTTEYPPLYGGGISTYCFHTATMLAEAGHMVTVFVQDESVKDYFVQEEDGIRLIRFNPDRNRLGADLGYIPRLSYEFAMILREMIRQYGKPDCIESQEYLAIPYYLLQFKLLGYEEFAEVPVVLTLHSPAFLYLYYNREGIYQFPNYWTGEMEMSCIRSADLVIAPSRYIIDEIDRHLPVQDTGIQVVRNPYRFAPQHSSRIPVKRNKIVFYGKLSPQKGVFELFAYLKELWDQGFSEAITVIGGTEKVYYPEMRTMGQIIADKYDPYIKKGLIQFKGKIPPAKRDECLADAHVILIPSTNDNLPYACIEAMSIGKVVLASMQGGQAEIIQDGVSGFLFDHADPASFGAKLKQVLALTDAALLSIGSAAIREIATSLSYEQVCRQKIALIANVKLHRHTPITERFPFTRPLPPPAPTTIRASPSALFQSGLLSVVIPYFNLGQYIRECVDSILASNYKQIEILIVDDGSTEPASIAALEQFADNPAVRIFSKKNEGLALTRNYGAKMAKGSFLAFLDADDKVHSGYYSRAIAVLTKYSNIAFAGAWVQYFGNKNGKWITWNPEPPYILLHNSVNSSALVYKTAAFLDGGLNDKAVDYGIEDYESVINMLAHGYQGIVLPECLFFYRIRSDSMYRSLTRHKFLYSYQYISEKHSNFYNNFAFYIFNLLNANGPSTAYENPSFEMHIESKTIYPAAGMTRLKTFIKKNPLLKNLALRLYKKLKSR